MKRLSPEQLDDAPRRVTTETQTSTLEDKMQKKNLTAAVSGVLVFAVLFLLLHPSAAQESGVRAVRLDQFVSTMPRCGFLARVSPVTYFKYASPGFDKCAYYDRKQGNFYFIDLDGRILQMFDFQSLGLGPPAHRAWSPDGSMMLCSVRNRERGGALPLYLLKVDGTVEEVAPAHGSAEQVLQPCWSHDGKMYAYVFVGRRGHEIRVREALSGKEMVVLHVPFGQGACGSPVWLSTGHTLLYVVDFVGDRGALMNELWAFDVSTMRRWKLRSDRLFSAVFPSPTDEQIGVLVGGKCFLLGIKGKLLQVLSMEGGIKPAWSPDGSRIAYLRGLLDPASEILLEQHVCVINVETGTETDLTPHPGLVVNAYRWRDRGTIVYW